MPARHSAACTERATSRWRTASDGKPLDSSARLESVSTSTAASAPQHAPGHLREPFECRAEVRRLGEDPGVRAGMRYQRRVVHLRAGPRRAPLEEAHAVRAVGHVTQAVPQHPARLPVHHQAVLD